MARVLESAEKNPVSYPLSTAFIFCFSGGPQSSLLSPGEKRKKSHKSIAPILALVCQLQSKCTGRQRKASVFPLKGWLCVSQSLVLKYVSLLGCCFSSCYLNRSSGGLGWKWPPWSWSPVSWGIWSHVIWAQFSKLVTFCLSSIQDFSPTGSLVQHLSPLIARNHPLISSQALFLAYLDLFLLPVLTFPSCSSSPSVQSSWCSYMW